MSFDVPTRSYVFAAEADAPARAVELVDRVREGQTSLDATVGELAATTRTVLDTADRRLRAAGLDLAIDATEHPAMFVLDGPPGARQLRVACSRQRRRYLVGDLPDGELAARLAAIVDVRALLPLVEIRRHEVPVTVLDPQAKTVVRLLVADLWALSKDTSEPQRLRGRVDVTGVLGYPRQFAQVDTALRGDPDLAEAGTDVADEAVTALGGSPGGLSSQVKVDLDGDEPAGEASRRILRRLADVVEANRPGALDDLDSEFLHDLRVALRRSRTVLRQMRRVFDPVAYREQADSLRWMQGVTGATRDLDVQLLEWDELLAKVPEDRRAALEPAHARLVEQRAAALRTMKATLRSAEYRRRWTAWRLFLAVDDDRSAGRDSERPIGKVVRRRIDALYARMVREGQAVTADSPAESLHELRKRGKSLRCLLEIYGRALWPASKVKPLVSVLKELQDVLGRHHDREVQRKRLRALAPELAQRPGGADALLAMGSLIDRLEADQRAARADVAERFVAFAQLDPRGTRSTT
ncbi:MAG TPA: CHAD domain-containing protein [Acidimicrobiales bacterium]|nr:CHAD domain-containing protein [Acidimicrobiales bacterium]